MRKNIKEYLKKDFFTEVVVSDEKDFWEEIYHDEDEFIEMLRGISPFKEDIKLLARTIVKYDKCSNEKTFDYIWKLREKWLRSYYFLNRSEVESSLSIDKRILNYIENL